MHFLALNTRGRMSVIMCGNKALKVRVVFPVEHRVMKVNALTPEVA